MRINNGFQNFMLIWSGQLVSKVGTGLTRFALLIWTYQQTESATAFALLSFFSFVPIVLVSPFAGVWIDRLNRRHVMWLADMGAGLATVCLLLLHATDSLQLWHLFVAEALAGAFEAFQGPAFTAVSTQLLPKEQYARAGGLRSMIDGSANIATPLLAGLLLPLIGIDGVMVVDLLTFVVAVTTLYLAAVPNVVQSTSASNEATLAPSFWREMRHGFAYIWQRPSLRSMLGLYTAFNFLDALTWFSLLPIMILARSGGDEMALAWINGVMGGAIFAGGLLISLWGGPKQKIHGYLAGSGVSFFSGGILIAMNGGIAYWLVGIGLAAIFVPFVQSSSDAIWQAKVPPALQGRVLSVYNMARQGMTPIGIVLGGLLADHWFEPAMATGGWLHNTFAPFVGSGAGSGMAVMFLGTAVLAVIVAAIGYALPAVRHIEAILPDHDQPPVALATVGD